ncbi:hypothetical protein V8E55_010488 [Tylopilus felleus]
MHLGGDVRLFEDRLSAGSVYRRDWREARLEAYQDGQVHGASLTGKAESWMRWVCQSCRPRIALDRLERDRGREERRQSGRGGLLTSRGPCLRSGRVPVRQTRCQWRREVMRCRKGARR